MKVRLQGSPQCKWDIDGHFYSGYDPIELTPQQVSKNKNIIMEYMESKEGIKKGDTIEVKEVSKDKDGTSVVKVIYTKKELEKKTFSQLREIGYRLGTKGRSSEELVKEILELQK